MTIHPRPMQTYTITFDLGTYTAPGGGVGGGGIVNVTNDPPLYVNFPHCTIQYRLSNETEWKDGTETCIPVTGYTTNSAATTADLLLRLVEEQDDEGSGDQAGDEAEVKHGGTSYIGGVQQDIGFSVSIPLGTEEIGDEYISAGILFVGGPSTRTWRRKRYRIRGARRGGHQSSQRSC